MKKSRNRHLFTLVVIAFASLLLVSCAAKKQFWGDEKNGFILTYRMDKGQSLQYTADGDVHIGMEMMGQAMDVGMAFTSKYTMLIRDVEDQNYISNVTIDDMSFNISSMQGDLTPSMSKVKGKSFDLTFSPLGKELDYSGIDKLTIDMGQMSGGEQSIRSYFTDILSDLPDKPVKIGETWTSKVEETIPRSGMEIKTVSDATHTLEGYETVDGYDCLKIQTKAKGTQQGSGEVEQMGMHLETEGDVETESTWYFAYKKGIFVKSISDIFSEGTIVMSGPQDMTIPMTTETKVEVKLVIPPPPPK